MYRNIRVVTVYGLFYLTMSFRRSNPIIGIIDVYLYYIRTHTDIYIYITHINIVYEKNYHKYMIIIIIIILNGQVGTSAVVVKNLIMNRFVSRKIQMFDQNLTCLSNGIRTGNVVTNLFQSQKYNGARAHLVTTILWNHKGWHPYNTPEQFRMQNERPKPEKSN